MQLYGHDWKTTRQSLTIITTSCSDFYIYHAFLKIDKKILFLNFNENKRLLDLKILKRLVIVLKISRDK